MCPNPSSSQASGSGSAHFTPDCDQVSLDLPNFVPKSTEEGMAMLKTVFEELNGMNLQACRQTSPGPDGAPAILVTPQVARSALLLTRDGLRLMEEVRRLARDKK